MKKMIAVLAAMVMLCCCAFASAETLLYATNPEYPPLWFPPCRPTPT